MKHTITKEKERELQQELHDILNIKWPEITRQLQAAREQGDLSENADYDAAKNEQANLNRRKEEIEDILNDYELIDDTKISMDRVSLGNVVKIFNYKTNQEEEYSIVGTIDVDPMKNRISNLSALGKALVGLKVNESVTLHIDNPYKVKVLEIK
ncbi:transcription elongation factor GreA [Ureaplasma zalophigenitalium]|uniref:Transcription elongation factor GreA n=1 Tax=Ureaplasma zalophigenitalium TaxID=907723 RepID=A0ABT3BPQ9_9BACT|nr:transcription elongation factor GreA [Ureaplasma zalophigenitalium]MCV3753993.1 transcription elongation factor GreA [Ureaplasma zalophigenitalium]